MADAALKSEAQLREEGRVLLKLVGKQGSRGKPKLAAEMIVVSLAASTVHKACACEAVVPPGTSRCQSH